MAALSSQHTDELKNRVRGQILTPGHPSYDEARKLWNAMIDRHPAVIVQCAEAPDVPVALDFARRQNLDVSIRGAAHNIAGNAVGDDGLTIDFSGMRVVRVDPDAKRAYAQAGATLADFDAAVQQHGLATPVGINSTTGIAGLTLGGGFGWLTRKYGMTIDNLLGAKVVTADGKKLNANGTENSDLFWALRGGGGNFGVVTEFEFQLHSIGTEVLAGLLVFRFEDSGKVLRQYRSFMDRAPEDLNVWVVLRPAPPLPFLPEAVHGKPVLVLAVFHAGDVAKGQTLIEPLRQFGQLQGEHVGPIPYVAWQQAFDPLLTAGARNYWKSHNFVELADGALDTMIDFAGRLPSPECEIFVGCVSGAANRVPAGATAYAHRDARYVLNVHGRWREASQDQEVVSWARQFFEATTPFASGGTYVNFMTEDELGHAGAAYGANHVRLAEIKHRYDPENVFHRNLNIKPKAA